MHSWGLHLTALPRPPSREGQSRIWPGSASSMGSLWAPPAWAGLSCVLRHSAILCPSGAQPGWTFCTCPLPGPACSTPHFCCTLPLASPSAAVSGARVCGGFGRGTPCMPTLWVLLLLQLLPRHPLPGSHTVVGCQSLPSGTAQAGLTSCPPHLGHTTWQQLGEDLE